MSDMPKHQYLSRDNKGWKLRRRVPADIQKLAGKNVWVERVSGVTHREACERANAFGVRTDAEMKRLRSLLRRSDAQSIRFDEPGCKFELSEHEISQIALAHFQEQEKVIQDAGGYLKGVTDGNRDEIRIDLAIGYVEAQAIESGEALRPDHAADTYMHGTAIRLLVRYGFVNANDVVETHTVRGKPRRRLCVRPEHKQSRSFQRLCDLLAQGHAEIARRRLEAVESGHHPTLKPTFFQPALTHGAEISPVKERRIGELLNAFLEQRKIEVERSRYSQLLIATRALEEELGRAALISTVSRDQCQAIADLFVEIPAYSTRHYPGKTLREAADAYEQKNGKRAQRRTEASKHLAVLKSIFEFAVDQEWIERNPAERAKIIMPSRTKSYSENEGGYEPFNESELTTIFSTPLFTGCSDDERRVNRAGPNIIRRSRFWAPLISLFSGLRMQEILQLEKSDIQFAEGVHFFSVKDAVHGTYKDGTYTKRLKARNSLRDVPIHPELVKIGFIDFAQRRNDEWLFPELHLGANPKLSDNFSKKFKTFMKPTGISKPHRKVFHSFRNTFNDAMRDAEIGIEIREQIMGWTDQSKMDSRYGKGHKIGRLAKEMSRVEYPFLDLSHLHTC